MLKLVKTLLVLPKYSTQIIFDQYYSSLTRFKLCSKSFQLAYMKSYLVIQLKSLRLTFVKLYANLLKVL